MTSCCAVKIELSIFRLSTELFLAELSYYEICLCCSQLSLLLQVHVLFHVVSGEIDFFLNFVETFLAQLVFVQKMSL